MKGAWRTFYLCFFMPHYHRSYMLTKYDKIYKKVLKNKKNNAIVIMKKYVLSRLLEISLVRLYGVRLSFSMF